MPGFRMAQLGFLLLGRSVICQADANINAGMSGAWYEVETTGQGVFLDVIPTRRQVLMAWFTYDPNHPAPGAAPVQWYTALGAYEGGFASLDVLRTTGGRFDETTDVSNELVGFASMVYEDCANFRLRYELFEGGQEGEINMQRLTPDVYCGGESGVSDPNQNAYNLPPQLSGVTATRINDQIEIRFDATDLEKDWLELSLTAVANDGSRHPISADHLMGYHGYPVLPNGDQWIRWNYQQDLNFMALGWSEFTIEVKADDRFVNGLQDIINMVSEARLIRDVELLQGVRHRSNPAGLAQARDYIRTQMQASPVSINEEPFTSRGTSGINIMAQSTLGSASDNYYIIDGHYDTVASTPGADDNATGTAGMLEAMRVLSQFNSEEGIQFMAFDQEELGLVGSRYHASQLSDPFLITGLINFEMIGYTCRGEPECVNFPNADDSIYNIRSSFATTLSDAFMAIGAEFVPELEIDATADDGDFNFRRSDHAPFWDLGVDALFIADGANFRTPHYHQATDLLPTLDTEFMTRVVKVAVGTIAQQAGVHHTARAISNLVQLD